METPKLCINCKFFKESLAYRIISPWRHAYAKCTVMKKALKSPYIQNDYYISLITGKGLETEKSNYWLCQALRSVGSECGIEGKLFQQREPKCSRT